MADNVTANSTDNAGPTFASDDIGGVQFPRAKLTLGADGMNDGDVSAANPLPVTGTVSTGGLTDTELRAVPVPISGTVTAAATNFDIRDLSSAQDSVASVQSGTWNVGLNAGTNNIGDVDIETLPFLVSTDNSTTSQLGNGATFTGTGEDVAEYGSISIFIYSDQNSAASGLQFQASHNNSTWRTIDTYTISASTPRQYNIGVHFRYFRLVYTNGTTLTTALQIQVTYHTAYVNPQSHRIGDAITSDNDAGLTKSVLTGLSPSGSFINVGVNPQGRLLTSGSTAAATSAVTSVSISATTTQLLAANTSRLGSTFYNNTGEQMYLKLGTTASVTSFTAKIAPGAYYETPFGYNGRIDALISSSAGVILVTELT